MAEEAGLEVQEGKQIKPLEIRDIKVQTSTAGKPPEIETKVGETDYIGELIDFGKGLGQVLGPGYQEKIEDISSAMEGYKQKNPEKYSSILNLIKEFEFDPETSSEQGTRSSGIESSTQNGEDIKYYQLEQLEELIKIEDINPPEELKELLMQKIKNNEFVPASPLEQLAEIKPSQRDWKFVARMVELGSNLTEDIYDIQSAIESKRDNYEILLGDKEFRELIEVKKKYNFIISIGDIVTFHESSLRDILLRDKIVFSDDVKREQLPLVEILREVPQEGQYPCLWGRERLTSLKNITDLTFGRAGRDPYKGWEYVAAMRGLDEKDIEGRQLSAEDVGHLENAREMFAYVQEKLVSVPQLKKRFDKVSATLEEWRDEGKKLEGQGPVTAGAYVKYDGNGLDLEKSLINNADLSEGEYVSLNSELDVGFKSASQIGRRLKYGIEKMYKYMTEKKDDFEKAVPLINLSLGRGNEESGSNNKDLEKKFPEIFESLWNMETIYKTQRGLYFTEPPLHAGRAGENVPDWDVRSYPLRDRAFYRIEKEGKTNFVNVKEYHVAWLGKDLRLRLYALSSEPDQNKLGESGFSVEIEREGKTRFLKQEEIKDLIRQLKEYTFPTLCVRDSPLLFL